MPSHLLLESGGTLLLESGGALLLESSSGSPPLIWPFRARRSAPFTPPATIDPAWWLLLCGGPPAEAVPVVTPIGTGQTIVGAIIDAFENSPKLEEFGGRVSYGESFPDVEWPYVELYEIDTATSLDSGDTYIDTIDFQFSVWDEDGAEKTPGTRSAGRLLRAAFDLCQLEFDDGFLIEFRPMTSRVMRHPRGYSRGERRQFQHVITYRALVNRTLD